MIRVRVDDFPQTKGEPQHTLAAYREFDRRLRECIGGKRYLLGVIPGRCTVDDILYLRRETDCVIGMHGINHDESKLDIFQNEFPPYLSQNEVGRLLIEASNELEQAVGRDVRVYMPPRNRIDRRTVEVLSDCGFLGYTAGPETPEELLRSDEVEVLYSLAPDEYGRTDELLARNSHLVLRELAEAGEDVILTLHWTWETNIGLDHMTKFFSQIPKKHFRDFELF